MEAAPILFDHREGDILYYIGNMQCDPNYLEHSGVKGMRWGVRRYQNEDGTLTEAGKLRYSKGLTDKERSRYDKYSTSTRGVKRSFDRMDKDYALHYGKFKEHEKRFNKKMIKAMDIAKNRYGGDVKAAEANDKKFNKFKLQAADSVTRAHSESLKMKDIESLQWKKIAQAHELGYDVNIRDINRSTISTKGINAVAGILGGVVGAATTLTRRNFIPAGAVGGALLGGGYAAYKLGKGNPGQMKGKTLDVRKGTGRTTLSEAAPRTLSKEQEEALLKSIEADERRKKNRDWVD